jgi:flagellar biosynthesis GTPase FlhF
MKPDIQNFLHQLAEAQEQTIAVLQKKQAILVKPEKEALASISAEEEEMLKELQDVLNRREEIITSARLQNIQGDSIEQLCEHFFPRNVEVEKLLIEARHRVQRIQLLAFTNWRMSRQSLNHISQILELLETGGQGKTTYHPKPPSDALGSGCVDRVA